MIYSRYKLRDRQLGLLDQGLEGLVYVCGTNLRDMVDEEDVSHIFLKVSHWRRDGDSLVLVGMTNGI